MDELKGKIVNVVLTVQEGKGLEPVRNQVHISANFNGRVLDSDPVPAADCPLIGTNLIWEIEKRDLRKIRSGNQPLRVECLGLDVQGRREKFGHLLLDLRSAQIVSNVDKVTYKWHKLIGVRNKRRNSSPELYLALAITGHESELGDDKGKEQENVLYVSDNLSKCSLPIEYLKDGFIQIGSDDCHQHYNLVVLIENASNLDLLLPEVLVFNQTKHKYCLSVKIFDVPIKTKVFSRDLHDSIAFDEKIVVRILSNMKCLKQFFDETFIEVGFLSGNDLLGSSIIKFDSAKIASLERSKLGNCRFKFPSPNGIVPTSVDGRQPSVSLEVSLEENSPKTEEKSYLGSGDHDLSVDESSDSFDLDEWKEARMAEFERDLERLKTEEIAKAREEYEVKKKDLEENVKKCKELQDELEFKLEEMKTSKALRLKRKSSTLSLAESCEENLKKYENCDQELLIEYLTKLQKDNDELKNLVGEQRRELETFHKTALTKEQTSVLLQELKGLEEKFEIAQQTKSYFKEQWKLACEEIHELKNDELKLIQDQIKERREELTQLQIVDHDAFY